MLATPPRDVRIDLLRGLAMIAMIVDHVAGPSPLRLLTGGNQFYTSAAEGFVLLAGFTAGIVSARAVQRGSLPATMRRFVGRAFLLYLLVCALTLVVSPDQALNQLADVLTLKQPTKLIEILVLYAMLFGLAPVASHLLANGRTLVFVAGSVVTWGGYQLAPGVFNLPFFVGRDGRYGFPLAAWQLLFCVAMAVGYHRAWIARRLTRAWRHRLLVLAGLTSVALLLLYHHTRGSMAALDSSGTSLRLVDHGFLQDAAGRGWFFGKASVQVGRLIASASIFSVLFGLTTVMGARAQTIVGRLLLPFGRNSLLAFVLHVVAVQSIAVVTTETGIGFSLTPLASASLQLLTLAFVLLGIRVLTRLPRLPRPQIAKPLALVLRTTAAVIHG